MSIEVPPTAAPLPWYKGLTKYMWFVFIVATLGWMFDTMGQQIFTLARISAIESVLHINAADKIQATIANWYAGLATMIFMIGWALGGIGVGILGDKIGRAKSMILTILFYSAFSGLSAFSVHFWDFALYRFLAGLGVGGQFSLGVSLVAEVLPDRSRPFALGWLQALSAAGNMLAGTFNLILGMMQQAGQIQDSWRILFLIGFVPVVLAIPVFLKLEEPEKWKAAKASGSTAKMGSMSELFGQPRWRRNTIVGMLLALSGVVGLWGIGFFTPDLIDQVFRKQFVGLSPQEIKGKLTFWKGMASLIQNTGAFFGVYAFARITHRLGRRPTFAIFFVLAAFSTILTFWFLNAFWQIFVLVPFMGFCQLALFGGYSIYLPELFPTRLRSTGTSFCYNVGRLVAAAGPLTLGLLSSSVFKGYGPDALRYAGITMCSFYLIGLLVLPFAPETHGQPLPE